MAAKKPAKKKAPAKAGAFPVGWGGTTSFASAEAKPVVTAPAIDWLALLARAEAMDADLTPEELQLWQRGLIDGNARMWNVEYVHATQCALKKHDPAQLLEMMAAEIPAPPFLLPLIAQAWSAGGGRPEALTVLEDKVIRKAFDRLTHPDSRMKPAQAKQYLAKARGTKKKNIDRSLARTET